MDVLALASRRAEAVAYLDDTEATFLAALRTALRAAFRPVLERLHADPIIAAGTPDDIPDPIFTPDDLAVIRTMWAVEVQGMLVPLVAEMYATGALGAILSIGPGALPGRSASTVAAAVESAVNQGAVDWLTQATNRLVAVGDEAWDAARTQLLDGVIAGEGIPDLATRIREALDVAELRAETIARTEVISASNAGSFTAAQVYGDLGPVRKTWMATLDSRTRHSHAEADGLTVPMAEPFTVGRSSLAFPGDPSGLPEEVINCRCTIVYDLPDDEIEQTGRQTGGTATLDLTAGGPPMRTRFRTAPTFRVPPPPGHRQTLAVDEPPMPNAPAPAPADDADTITLEVPEGINIEPFSTIMAIEGRWTGDDRFLLPGAARWDGMLPIPFTTDHVDDVPSVVGLIGRVERIPIGDGVNLIAGWGFLDLGTDERPNEPAFAVRDRVRAGSLRGGSIRVDDETLGGVDPATVADGDDEWWMYVVEDCRLRAFSPTPVAAFPEAAIFLNPDDIVLSSVPLPPAPENPAVALSREELEQAQEAAEEMLDDAIDALPPEIADDVIVLPAAGGPGLDLLVAAGPPPDAPPAEWFQDPQLDGPTPMTVDDDGRVFGHIATWDTCHTAFSGQCITPPHTATGYAAFRTGEVVCADGSRVAVGRLTMGTGHASTHRNVTPVMAAAHYDHTGTAVADVASGEDRHGIWIAGAARSTLTDAQLRTMRSSPPSGDWRRIGTSMELVAALLVNVPGFPVPRARIASGVPQSLVAAGMVRSGAGQRRAPSPDLDGAAQRVAASIGRDRASLVAALRARVHGVDA